ncbi:MAG: hypothetical protein RIC89_19140 [Pseudomonadales bacterium]
MSRAEEILSDPKAQKVPALASYLAFETILPTEMASVLMAQGKDLNLSEVLCNAEEIYQMRAAAAAGEETAGDERDGDEEQQEDAFPDAASIFERRRREAGGAPNV